MADVDTYGIKQAPPETDTRSWTFVDLIPVKPDSYVVPEGWMVEDICKHHRANLDKHGGARKVNRKSKHHEIRLDRINQ
ncbi:MAG: hypothetical protein ACR2JU_02830 [Nocardioidaceae bacterium]